jgi:hypothetical protein
MTDNDVRLVAEYDDGLKVHFTIDRCALEQGDHVARIIARDRQRDGSLPRGTIKTVSREG